MKLNKPVFTGSAVALVTPFKENMEVNYDKLRELLDYHLENETDAIVVTGTTGEASTLDNEEHLKVVGETVKHVKGKIPVIGGTGSNNTKQCLYMSGEAVDLGVDALLLVTPYYNKTSQEGLIAHYTKVANSVPNTPIILYNVPSRTGMTITPQTYYILSQINNIVATKEASGDLKHIHKIYELCKNTLDIYSGNDDQIADILNLGGIGVISVLANILPKDTHIMSTPELIPLSYQYKMQEYYNPLISALFSDVNPIAVKEAMNMLGLDVGEPRLPLIRTTEEKQMTLKRVLKKYEDDLRR